MIKKIKNIFSGRSKKINLALSKDEFDTIENLISEKKAKISLEMHRIADEKAKNGVMVEVKNIFDEFDYEISKQSDVYKNCITRLEYNFSGKVPYNTALRIFRGLICEEFIWDENPGINEEYLKSRDGNPLYPKSKRIISIKEIFNAKKKDKELQVEFNIKYELFKTKFYNLKNNSDFFELYKEVLDLKKEALKVRGSALMNLPELDSIIELLCNEILPKNQELEKLALDLKNISNLEGFLIQFTVVEKDDLAAFILSSDDETIFRYGNLLLNFGNDFQPGLEDLELVLKNSVKEGLCQERAEYILDVLHGNMTPAAAKSAATL